MIWLSFVVVTVIFPAYIKNYQSNPSFISSIILRGQELIVRLSI